eukprot:868937_1
MEWHLYRAFSHFLCSRPWSSVLYPLEKKQSRFMAFILHIWIIYFIYQHAVLGKNCSASRSYVQILSPESKSRTLTSIATQFQPYNYLIEPTELVVLSPDDDICSGSLSTDITDKIVVIFPANSNCSHVSRVYAAEQMGATAALIVDDNPSSGAVSPIIDTNPSDNISPTIPARVIPYNQALSLYQTCVTYDIWMHTYTHCVPVLETMTVEFGCKPNVSSYSILCVIDTSGDHWWMDGDYQLQVGVSKNGHPVWSKDGYLLVLDRDLFLYLNDGDGQHAWYWAI